ncbi:hypothetical protein ACL02R_15145 [Streptomyces sp. MS19]|uniref:hypothetical protein n=1 Tax=Streptomyces sp. MS19 TaxID=3385972 RepID=UPI00399F10D8
MGRRMTRRAWTAGAVGVVALVLAGAGAVVWWPDGGSRAEDCAGFGDELLGETGMPLEASEASGGPELGRYDCVMTFGSRGGPDIRAVTVTDRAAVEARLTRETLVPGDGVPAPVAPGLPGVVSRENGVVLVQDCPQVPSGAVLTSVGMHSSLGPRLLTALAVAAANDGARRMGCEITPLSAPFEREEPGTGQAGGCWAFGGDAVGSVPAAELVLEAGARSLVAPLTGCAVATGESPDADTRVALSGVFGGWSLPWLSGTLYDEDRPVPVAGAWAAGSAGWDSYALARCDGEPAVFLGRIVSYANDSPDLEFAHEALVAFAREQAGARDCTDLQLPPAPGQ